MTYRGKPLACTVYEYCCHVKISPEYTPFGLVLKFCQGASSPLLLLKFWICPCLSRTYMVMLFMFWTKTYARGVVVVEESQDESNSVTQVILNTYTLILNPRPGCVHNLNMRGYVLFKPAGSSIMTPLKDKDIGLSQIHMQLCIYLTHRLVIRDGRLLFGSG